MEAAIARLFIHPVHAPETFQERVLFLVTSEFPFTPPAKLHLNCETARAREQGLWTRARGEKKVKENVRRKWEKFMAKGYLKSARKRGVTALRKFFRPLRKTETTSTSFLLSHRPFNPSLTLHSDGPQDVRRSSVSFPRTRTSLSLILFSRIKPTTDIDASEIMILLARKEN